MNRFIITLLFCCCFVAGKSQDTTEILKKATVINASEADMQAAILTTEGFIKDINLVAPLFDRFLILGTTLWNKIKEAPDFKDIPAGNVTFKIPQFDKNGKWVAKVDAPGKLIQDIVPYLKFWTYIKTNFNLANAIVAERTNRDRFIYWLYFAKIEEPLVSIQTDKARLLIKYVKGKIFFIDIVGD